MKRGTVLPTRKEADVLRECLAYLRKVGIFHMRMNTGAVKTEKRFVRFGTPGCADILAIKRVRLSADLGMVGGAVEYFMPIWIECKSSVGKQSGNQTAFQRLVESEGHRYVVVRSVAEMIAGLQ